MGLIYMRTSPSGGRYIGQTRILESDRWNEHIKEAFCSSSANYSTLLNKAIRKYGSENFSVKILEDNLPDYQLNDREKYWIEFYKTYYKDNNHGYNMTRGGEGGTKYSDKKILKLWKDGYNFNEIAKILGGQSQTFSNRLKGLGITENAIAERVSIHARIQNTTVGLYQNEIVDLWRQGISQSEIARRYNSSNTTIKKILVNAGIDEDEFKLRNKTVIKKLNNANSIPVLQLDLTGNIIKEFPSISEAARQFNTNPGVISRACTGARQTAKGYRWRIKNV